MSFFLFLIILLLGLLGMYKAGHDQGGREMQNTINKAIRQDDWRTLFRMRK